MIDLSILIPVYNGEKYVKQCLSSIKLHPSIEIEIIAVDDGSTDTSFATLNKYTKNEKRLKVYRYDGNKGIGYARNYLLQKAKGVYVYYIDIDDEIVFNHVLRAYEIALENKLDIYVGECQKIVWKNETNIRPVENLNLANQVISGHDFFIYSATGIFKGVGIWRNLYNRQFLVENNILFSEGIVYEDNEYFPRVHQYAKRVMYQNFILYKYYERENSIISSTKNYMLKVHSRVYILNSLMNLIEENKNDKTYLRALYNFISYNVLSLYRIDTKSLDKKMVGNYYSQVPKKTYLYILKSESKIGKIVGLVLYINIYIGKWLINMLDQLKGGQ